MITAYILVNTASGKERFIINRLKRMPQVKESRAVLGSFDVFAKVECYDLSELSTIVNTVRGMEGVVSTNTLTAFEPTAIFKKVNAVILLVSDIERSKRFYRDVLGLKIKYETPEWVEFFKEGAVLALNKNRSGIKVSKEKAMLNFITSDINYVKNTLREKGVNIYKDIQEDSRGKYMVIEDPDSYKIIIVEPKVKEDIQATGYYGFAPV
jgi:lactoylglutathione lyase